MTVGLVFDEFDFASLGVEDENRAHFLIGDVEVAFGIEGHTVWLAELEQHFLFRGRLRAREAIHPGIFLGLRLVYLRKLFGSIKCLVPDASDRRRVRPDDIGIVNDGRSLSRLVVLLFLSKHGRRDTETQKKK